MANCNVTRRKLNKTFITEKVVLELSPEEAYALATVLDNVGGSPENSPRMFIKEICNSLDNTGIESPIKWEERSKYMSADNAIYFQSNTLEKFLEKALIRDNQ